MATRAAKRVFCPCRWFYSTSKWSSPQQLHRWHEPDGVRTKILVYNSLTRSKVPLVVPKSKPISCSYVRFDVLRRIMKHHFGLAIHQVMGITDIDDKIIVKAKELGEPASVVAQRYEDDFLEDMASLGVLPPDRYTRVTDYIPEIVHFIEEIVAKGYGYTASDGSVYFDTDAYGDQYGKLQFGIGQEVSDESTHSEKKCPRDFALWKGAKPGEPLWPGPKGYMKGRPGWHIECSAMASFVFGPSLDIHTGGIDLLFPHHNNEIAQCEACHSVEQWCNYFLHSGHLSVSQEKMSKSLGNYVTIKDFLKKYSASQFRIFCLLSSYRSGIEYTESSLKEAVSLEKKLSSFLESCGSYVRGQMVGGDIIESDLLLELSTCQRDVLSSFADDFDTATAMKRLLRLVHITNRQLFSDANVIAGRNPSSVAAVAGFVESQMELLGCNLSSSQGSECMNSDVMDTVIDFRSRIRQLAKASNDPLKAEVLLACDELREKLKAQAGITVKDSNCGATWQMKRGR
ncbi:cysteine--tRNA ligase, mitochondrial-like isoform X2 [Oscarella lobularis]|uniref:cysteine--tRNA ligase, mitochondrial-like isoform X2 n=1 Tax=Oscarella lobularis TaxID=121494 RepID=UPI0033138DCB